MTPIFSFFAGVLLSISAFFGGASQFGASIYQVVQGGTGSSTLSGILIGNGTSPVRTLTVGSNLTLSGTTLSASGGGGGFSWSTANTYNQLVYATSTPTLWFQSGLFSSSTVYIGAGGAGSSTVQYGPDNLAWTAGYFGLNNNFVIGSSTALAPFPALTIDKLLKTTLLQASTTDVSARTAAFGGTGTTSIASTGVITTPVASAILLTSAGGAVSGYSGSNPCTNQVALSLSALGVISCTSVSNAMLSNAAINFTYAGNIQGPASIALGASGTLTVGYDWTPATNYAVNTNSTTTPIWAKGAVGGVYSFMASNTAAFDVIKVGSSTNSTLATSTFFGNLEVNRVASTTWLTAVNASTSVLTIGATPNCSGSNALTTTATGLVQCGAITSSSGAFPFTPTNNFAANVNSTSTTLLLSNGLQASTTIRFGDASDNGQFYFKSSLGLGIGTSTPQWPLTLASSTASQLALTDSSATSAQWLFRNINGNLYIGTSTPSNFATTTFAALSITSNGQLSTGEQELATSTAMTIDWLATQNQILIRMGSSATNLGFNNASTSGMTKRIVICNPNATAGTITWKGIDIYWPAASTSPTQTLTANYCDTWYFFVTQATSTTKTTTKVFGSLIPAF